MRSFRYALTAAVFCSSLSILAAEPKHPHIVFILTDDMGMGDVSCYGKGIGLPTPNIDRIAKEGARFDWYYSAAPICSPSRAAILSGEYPGKHRLNSYLQIRAGNRNCDQNDFLDPEVSHLPKTLKKAGYATAHFGKWHLGGGRDVDNAPSIGKYGFDEWASTWESPEPHPDLGVKFAPWDKQMEPNQVKRHDRTAYMVDRSLDFLRRNKDKPCFVNLWPDDTHTPHRPSPEMARKHGANPQDDKKTPKKSFLGVLEEYDKQMGRLLDGIRDLGIEKDTIVIFTCDNGPEPHFEHARTDGLRGMKLCLYEGGIRLPFLARWPGHIPAGHTDDKTVLSGLDIGLTLCGLAGVEPDTRVVVRSDGSDMSSVLLGKPVARSGELFWEYGRKKTGYGYPHIPNDRSPNLAVRKGQWKLLVNDDGTSEELYDLSADPKETDNVADNHTTITKDLSARVIEWRKTLPGRNQDGGSTDTTDAAPRSGGKGAEAIPEGSAIEKPNFIVILADDLGYADLGCYGQKRIRTPNLDRMAAEGVRFTNFYVASSLCSPSRAALLTGSYAQRVGLGVCSRERDGKVIPWHVLYPNSQQGLNPEEVTIAERLKSRGYATACVGKWHLGDAPEHLPTRQGFDHYYGIPYSNDMKPTVIMRQEQVVEKQANQETITDQYTEEAVKWITEKKDEPFFLYLAHNAPHTPLHVEAKHGGKSPGGLYGDVVERLDWGVGEILSALRKTGIDEKTMVVFLSDNGPWLARGENGGFATPLRNGKGSTYEGGMRVPFIARWPGAIPAGNVCEEMATAMDLLPTFASLAGCNPQKDPIIDGKDILPLLKTQAGAATPHDALYYYFMDELQAVRSGPWKLKLETTVAHDSHYTHAGDPESTVPATLYNLETDPGEQKSVLKDHPDIEAQLQALVTAAREDLGDSARGISGKNRRPAGYVSAKK